MSNPKAFNWAIDLGNTRVKIGLLHAGQLREYHVWSGRQSASALAWLLAQPAASYALLSTSANEKVWLDALQSRAEVYQYAAGKPCPLRVEYDTPHSLGHDRLAAAVGAWAIYPACASLIIDAGTCITFEWVSAAGAYQGGNISPGVRMRLRAMHEFTGKLPMVTLDVPEAKIGRDTVTALQNGAVRGAAAEISQVLVAFRQNYPNGRVLLCGGDVPLLRPLLPEGLIYRPSLVVEGLAKLHEHARID